MVVKSKLSKVNIVYEIRLINCLIGSELFINMIGTSILYPKIEEDEERNKIKSPVCT